MTEQLNARSSARTRIISVFAALALLTAIGIVALSVKTDDASASPFAVGIGDNGPLMFQDQRYLDLHTKISRVVVAWDYEKHPDQDAYFEQWLAGAKAAGVQPLVAFNHSTTSPTKLPTTSAYEKVVRNLLKEHPEVKTISPWNEANHKSQPTSKKPKQAALYYNAVRKVCSSCKIVAADVLDQKNMIPWLTTFKKTAVKPKIWGLHSYSEVNRNVPWSKSSAKELLKIVKGKVWLTEVGGVVAFSNSFKYNESRASTATKNVLKLAKRDKRIERVYFYSWFGNNQPKKAPYLWDSGFVSYTGEPRPAYYTLRNWLNANPGATTAGAVK
jgi:hypothetical protein